jgi:hypothetical protein
VGLHGCICHGIFVFLLCLLEVGEEMSKQANKSQQNWPFPFAGIAKSPVEAKYDSFKKNSEGASKQAQQEHTQS